MTARNALGMIEIFIKSENICFEKMLKVITDKKLACFSNNNYYYCRMRNTTENLSLFIIFN